MRVSFACFLILLLAVACAPTGPEPRLRHVPPLSASGTVFVTSNGWHSGIVLSREILMPDRIPEAADFPAARYLEFGWGDAEYYPAKTPSIADTLRAGLLPTPAVMHVAALDAQPSASSSVEVVALLLDAEQLGRLIAYIGGSFDREGESRVAPSGPGLYRNSHFYPARGRFHLANTCNTWTARALVVAGLTIDETEAALAEDLMAQVRLHAIP